MAVGAAVKIMGVGIWYADGVAPRVGFELPSTAVYESGPSTEALPPGPLFRNIGSRDRAAIQVLSAPGELALVPAPFAHTWPMLRLGVAERPVSTFLARVPRGASWLILNLAYARVAAQNTEAVKCR